MTATTATTTRRPYMEYRPYPTADDTPLRVPYVIAWSKELRTRPMRFDYHRPSGGYRLTYDNPREGDWDLGVLKARSGKHRGGEPRWAKLNTFRQWQCMKELLCQVCGMNARDEDGRYPWILAPTGHRKVQGLRNSSITNAPPTCWACMDESLRSCPKLLESHQVFTAEYAEPYAVLADLFVPLASGGILQTNEPGKLEEVTLDAFRLLTTARAHQLLVQVYDKQRVRL